MRLVLLFALTLTAAGDPHGSKPAAGHPLLGKWSFAVPDSMCAEIYDFRADGTRHFASADERGESAYEISPAPSERGFYRLVDTVTKNNGKRDCSGGTTPVGDTVTMYVRMHPSKDMFLVCAEESPDRCFGPFVRMKERE